MDENGRRRGGLPEYFELHRMWGYSFEARREDNLPSQPVAVLEHTVSLLA